MTEAAPELTPELLVDGAVPAETEAAPELTPELLVDSAVPAETEAVPELTPELLVDSAVPAEPAISPDGRLVAYAVSTVGVRERLARRPVDRRHRRELASRAADRRHGVGSRLPVGAGLGLALLPVGPDAAPDAPRRCARRPGGAQAASGTWPIWPSPRPDQSAAWPSSTSLCPMATARGSTAT